MRREYDVPKSGSLASASTRQDGWLVYESAREAYENSLPSDVVCASWRGGFILARDLYDLPEGATVVAIRRKSTGHWDFPDREGGRGV